MREPSAGLHELPLSDEHMRLCAVALDQAADFVIITEVTSSEDEPIIRHVNASLLEATGYEAHDLIGKPSILLFSPFNDPKVRETIRDRQHNAQPAFQEFLLRRVDGTDMWTEFVGRPVSMSASHNYRIVVGREITLRKRTATETSLFSAAVEESRDRIIIYETDASGALLPLYENQRAMHACRYRLAEWLSESNGAKLRNELLEYGEICRMFTDSGADGMPQAMQLTAKILKNANGIQGAVSIERAIGVSDRSAVMPRTPLQSVAMLVTLIGAAVTTQERFAILRALLDKFDAELVTGEPSTDSSVRIDTTAACVSFTFAGVRRTARWNASLDDASLTALRFAIEASLEHERLGCLTAR